MTTEQKEPLALGLHHRERLLVEPRHTVPQVEPSWPGFRDMPPVLATAMMIAFIEETCIRALQPFLSPGQRTVGIRVDVSHVSPTPVGMHFTSEVVLTGIAGKSLQFDVRCHDERGLIGEGTHQRAIIDITRFSQRLLEKAAAA